MWKPLCRVLFPINYNKFKYPLFETTAEEKEVLRDALKHMQSKQGTPFLCTYIGRFSDKTNQENRNSLLDKISYNLAGKGTTLDWYVRRNRKVEWYYDLYKLRQVWILQLLSYNNYENRME